MKRKGTVKMMRKEEEISVERKMKNRKVVDRTGR